MTTTDARLLAIAVLNDREVIWINDLGKHCGSLTRDHVREKISKARALGFNQLEVAFSNPGKTLHYEIHRQKGHDHYGLTWEVHDSALSARRQHQQKLAVRRLLHDMRNPLAVVQTTVELMMETATGEDLEDLTTVHRNAKEILKLMDLVGAVSQLRG